MVRYIPGRLDAFSNAIPGTHEEREEIMIYPSALITAKILPPNSDPNKRKYLKYTKHYYIGSQRISSVIGTGSAYLGCFPEINGTTVNTFPGIRTLANQTATVATQALVKTYQEMGLTVAVPNPVIETATVNISASSDSGTPYAIYFYHPDHLAH